MRLSRQWRRERKEGELMKTGLIAIVCAVLGFVAGVFAGPSIRGEKKEKGAVEIVAAKSAKPVVDELFAGEAKDGELVEIKLDGQSYGQFRLSPKQKEVVEKKKTLDDYCDESDKAIWAGKSENEVNAIKKKFIDDAPWLLDPKNNNQVSETYKKMVISLLESRKKAAANK